MEVYYVYVLLCEGGSLYTGYTNDLDLRMKLHRNGKGARYTRMQRPKKLVYFKEVDSRKGAIRRERAMKKLTRRQKIDLIASHQCPAT